MSMESRGVTRPMAEMEGEDDSHEMTHQDRLEMLHSHHKQTLWIYWCVVILGFWVMASPWTFGYGNSTVDPSGGRDLWLTLSQRIDCMIWSDLLAGAGLVFFGWRSLTPNRPISLWICCFIGVWLTAAPILFWAPTAAAYLNATVVGALVMALTVLIPGMPNMIMYMKMGPPTPPGWSYNPSSWPQRWILIVLGFAGWMVSRYLGAFQLGYIDTLWEPFFGSGSRQVLNSTMSHSLPISDGSLGSFAYTFEFLMGFMGSPSRWRTMPWMVTLFGILVIPLGLVHILLVISQPLVVGEWCTLCLVAALLMLPMLPLEGDEVIAMGQHLWQRTKAGEPFWRVFWKGGEADGCTPDERSPELIDLPQKPGKILKSSCWGFSSPLNLTLSVLVGILIVTMPGLLGIEKPASDIYHLGGSLIVVCATVAMGEVFRTVRYLNIPLGVLVAFGPPLVGSPGQVSLIAGAVLGLAAAALAWRLGPITENYGSWDRFVK